MNVGEPRDPGSENGNWGGGEVLLSKDRKTSAKI
jgi:hypothetical protein